MNLQKPSRLSQVAAWPFKGLVYLYRWLISPLLPPSCRYAPSCSEYALEALNRHGVFAGSWYTLKRLGRCQPWGGEGYDPVPGTDHDYDHGLKHGHDHDKNDHRDYKSAEISFASHSANHSH